MTARRRVISRSIVLGRVIPAALLGGVLGLVPSVAQAEPATTMAYPKGASATRFTGNAFDTCAAPSSAALAAWSASPYDAVGVYIGGPNRTCAQPNLTSSWVTTVTKAGWRLIPIFMGHQPPCTFRANATEFTAATAAVTGTSDASTAVSRAAGLGIRPGSAIYGDVEHYLATDTSCRTAVRAYVSAWTKELHRRGYLAGVYVHLFSGAKHLSDSYGSTTYARPDAVWIARWDGSSALSGWTDIPDSRWANHQRAKQYRGDHNETHGGVTINIDSDYFDAPVATVAQSYVVTSSSTLNARSRPSTSGTLVRTYEPGARLSVVCQTPGSKVGGTSVWDLLTNGTYVSDLYVSTPSQTGYSRPLPRCRLPHQVTAAGLKEREGPGTSYAVVGTLDAGALAWVVCQRSGSTVSNTSVWDKLDDGAYVTDYYVATKSATGFSTPIPRC